MSVGAADLGVPEDMYDYKIVAAVALLQVQDPLVGDASKPELEQMPVEQG